MTEEARAKKILVGILSFIMLVSGLAPYVLGYTFKGTIGEMNMAGYETFYRTVYSNYSKRYYTIFNYFNPDIINDWSIVYSHSLYGYSFSPAHTLWNTSSGNPDYGTEVGNRNFAIYLEPNGRYLHTAYRNATDDGWYWKFEINATTGQIYPVTNAPQMFIQGAGWSGAWAIRDEISIVVDSEGYPWIGAECFDGAQNSYWVFQATTNDGTWATEVFNEYSLELEWIANGGGNPSNDMWGGSLLPSAGKDIIAVFWYRESAATQEFHQSMYWDDSASDWVNTGGSIFNDNEGGDWAEYAFSFGYNVQSNLSVIVKQHESNPDAFIGLEALILDHQTHTWGANFQVGFDEAGDAGSVVFNPFASISDEGAINFIWYKTGNVTIWKNRMYPNGTMEGYSEEEDSEFALEDYQFSVTPGIMGDDRPIGIMWMDEASIDYLYYDTEVLFLGSNFSLPAIHLNTTLTGPDGSELGTAGNEDWLFEGEVYDLEAYVENATTFTVNTTDSRHEILFRWDNSTNQMWIEVTPNDQFTIGLAHSESERTGNITRLLWRFIPDRSIIDSLDNDWFYTIVNSDMGFSLTADLGIDTNFYNLGGFTSYTFTGDGGRTPGGQPFEIYATNGTDGSSARAEQIYRKLQSIHFLVELDLSNEWDAGNGEFDIENAGQFDIGIDYRINATWVQGWFVRLSIRSSDVGHHNAGNDHDWIEWNVDWYNYNATLDAWHLRRQGQVITNHWGYDNENLSPDHHNRTTSQLWIDLWFDRTNASSTVAGQVNAMYHGMREHGSSWWFGYGDFMPMISEYGNSMYLDDLSIQGYNITDSMAIDLIRVYVSVDKDPVVDGDDEPWGIRAIENFNRKLADDRMMGGEQPAFEETLVLDMPMFQSMNPLIRAIDGISVAIWRGALGFQKILWGAMDSFFAWAGFGAGFFSQITAFIMMIPQVFTAIMQNMGVAITHLVTMIDDTFSMVIAMLPEFVLGMGWLVDSILAYWQTLNQLLNGGLMPFNIIQSLGMGVWIRFMFSLLPTFEMLAILFSNNPGQRLKERVGFYSGLFNGAINFIRGMIAFMQNAIQTIMEILPG